MWLSKSFFLLKHFSHKIIQMFFPKNCSPFLIIKFGLKHLLINKIVKFFSRVKQKIFLDKIVIFF